MGVCRWGRPGTGQGPQQTSDGSKRVIQELDQVRQFFSIDVGLGRGKYMMFVPIGGEGKYRRIVEARSLLCYWAVRELGVPMSSLARKLGISIPSVSESVTRGRRIAEEKQLDLLET
jgi:hypothetical protein